MIYRTFEIRNISHRKKGGWKVVEWAKLNELLQEAGGDIDHVEEGLSLGAAMITFRIERWSSKMHRHYHAVYQVRKHGGQYHAALVNARNYIKGYEYTLTSAQPDGPEDYDEIVGIIEDALN